MQKAGAIFNPVKLLWFNKEYIKKLPMEKITEEITKRFPKEYQDKDTVGKIAPIILDRINVFSDIDQMVTDGEVQYFFAAPKIQKEMLVWKKGGTEKEAKENLSQVSKMLEKLSERDFVAGKMKEILMPFAEEKGRGNVLWPLRVALSGKEKSPDPFTLLAILGKEESEKRIRSAVDALQ